MLPLGVLDLSVPSPRYSGEVRQWTLIIADWYGCLTQGRRVCRNKFKLMGLHAYLGSHREYIRFHTRTEFYRELLRIQTAKTTCELIARVHFKVLDMHVAQPDSLSSSTTVRKQSDVLRQYPRYATWHVVVSVKDLHRLLLLACFCPPFGDTCHRSVTSEKIPLATEYFIAPVDTIGR